MAKETGTRKKIQRSTEVDERLRKYQVGGATMRLVGIVAGKKVIKITYVVVITK